MKKIVLFLFSVCMIYSCSTDVEMNLPRGPEGKSAYDVWVESVEQGIAYYGVTGEIWPADRTTLADFYFFLTGQNGETPYIKNGNWWIDGKDTGIPTTGNDGIDGKDADMPYIKDGNWWVGDSDTGVKAEGIDGIDGQDGEDGNTPYIGRNGNWWIDGCDTGKPARGKKGEDGEDGDDGKDGKNGKNGSVITIKDGYWYIDGKNTKVRAFGRDGKDGEDGSNGKNGLSAYEQWKGSLPSGIDNPRKDLYQSSFWPMDKNSIEDFWDYLSGIDGIDGQDGKDGENGQDGKDGLSAYELWLKAGNHGTMKDFLRSLKGRDGEDGKDGLTPFIRNGYWWIGDYNTRIRATGEDGKDGKDGDKGEKGASAYDLWKKEVNKGLENTRKDLYDNHNWPKSKTSIDDFWDYLSGMDGINGKDGLNGQDGEDGKDLDKPDAAYIDVPRNIYDLFSVGTGYVSTVSANYPWTYKIITENANIKVDDYFSNIKAVYETTYNMPDGSSFTTYNGSIALTVKKVPDRDMKFEIRFETHNGDYRWVHNSIVITLHAYGTPLARSNNEQGDGYIHLNPNIK